MTCLRAELRGPLKLALMGVPPGVQTALRESGRTASSARWSWGELPGCRCSGARPRGSRVDHLEPRQSCPAGISQCFLPSFDEASAQPATSPPHHQLAFSILTDFAIRRHFSKGRRCAHVNLAICVTHGPKGAMWPRRRPQPQAGREKCRMITLAKIGAGRLFELVRYRDY